MTLKMEEFSQYSKVLFTALKLIYPKYHPIWFIFYMYVLYNRTVKRKTKYKIRSVPIKLIEKLVKANNFLDDVNNVLLVNKHNVYRSDKLLLLFCERNCKYRSVHILPISEWEKDVVGLSETLNENLENVKIHSPIQLLASSMNKIKFAEEINISLINSPLDINHSVTDAILERYFKKPKLVNKGDIIEIDVKFFAEDVLLLNNKLSNVESIYFKCNKVIHGNVEVFETYYCVIGETSVSQSVDIQSFLPKKIAKIVSKDNPSSFRIPLCPYGFEKDLEKIQRAVKPFITGRKINLKPTFLLTGNPGSGKDILLSSLAAYLGMHYYQINNYELIANVYAQNETKLHNIFFNAKMAAPCIIAIRNFENFGKNNDGIFDERIMSNFADELEILFEKNTFPVLLFCCSNKKDVPTDLKKLFLECFEISAPSDIQREQNMRWILDEKDFRTEANLADIANKTHGFYFGDLQALIYYAQKDFRSTSIGEVNLGDVNFLKAIDHMQKNYNDSLGAPKVPKVLWSDVGGLGDVKEEIIKTINLPLKHPEFFEKSGLRRSGILLFGPPGTGKTLIAKAVATECGLCFLSVKGPELLNMYVGQSEQNIREVFERARGASPCIIFFDELDSLAPNRGMSGDSGGVMDRVVSQLLAEMDGLNESAIVFIIGATNRPDLIDPALLRPGRFDKLLYIGPCTDKESKISVLKALTRQFNLDTDVDLAEIVGICPKNITGADFYGICSTAWSSAVRRLIGALESGEASSENVSQKEVIVNFQDFANAMRNLKPSISTDDLQYFDQLKREMSSNV
ncbi:unnamed protein product [Phaedon cochleariae]|uniref:Peroxisomal ATPase PEX6 n=1 Tax=Phaedon cochleariae TaxID=80249 RepID=A0A9N9SE36_PHACE|nr:unnamed protein product [Phaedon cochleariae]